MALNALRGGWDTYNEVKSASIKLSAESGVVLRSSQSLSCLKGFAVAAQELRSAEVKVNWRRIIWYDAGCWIFTAFVFNRLLADQVLVVQYCSSLVLGLELLRTLSDLDLILKTSAGLPSINENALEMALGFSSVPDQMGHNGQASLRAMAVRWGRLGIRRWRISSDSFVRDSCVFENSGS